MRAKFGLGMRVSAGGIGAWAVFRHTTWSGPDPSMPTSGVWIGQVMPPSQLKAAIAPMRNQPVSTYGASWTGQTLGSGPRYSHAWSLTADATGTCTFVHVSP